MITNDCFLNSCQNIKELFTRHFILQTIYFNLLNYEFYKEYLKKQLLSEQLVVSFYHNPFILF